MGRPYPLKTPLAKRMYFLRLPVYVVAAKARCSARQMTEYLAAREMIQHHHLADLARVLDCEPEDIATPRWMVEEVLAGRDTTKSDA